MADVERDCAHWLEFGWVCRTQPGEYTRAEWWKGIRDGTLPVGAVFRSNAPPLIWAGKADPLPYVFDDDDCYSGDDDES